MIFQTLKVNLKLISLKKSSFKALGDIIEKIAMYDIQVTDAAKNLSPKVIARYCYELAVAFSSFYEHVMVLNAESDELIKSRLLLVHSFSLTLGNALSLLGIDSPSRM